MNQHIAVETSPTREILNLTKSRVPDYIASKRRNLELGGIIAKLNHELMFGSDDIRRSASDALQKLGYVLD